MKKVTVVVFLSRLRGQKMPLVTRKEVNNASEIDREKAA